MGDQVEENEQSHPLLTVAASPSSDTNSSMERTGTVWTAIIHIITGVIGSGVLSLAWSVAQLGWIAGPVAMVVFGIITIISSNILCDFYRHPDAENGPNRNRSYAEAVRSYLGGCNVWVVWALLCTSYYGDGIAYTIAAAISMRAVLKSNCYHKHGHDAPCEYGNNLFMILFGAVEVVFSQIPNFHGMELLSIAAAVMSFAYAFIGLGLGFAKVLENGEVRGDLFGVTTATAAQKVWLSAQALGDIAFAFNYNVILFDIQDTLRAPPAENRTMKKASTSAILITSFFFLLCGCFGYAAFGNQAPGNLLTGFGFYEPYWLVDIANVCIVLHLVGGYQIYSQPLFAGVERMIKNWLPNSGFVIGEHPINLPLLPGFSVNLLRLCFRTVYVVSTTAISIRFPNFNQVIGILGALNFWALAIYFPVKMYLRQNEVGSWTGTWLVAQAFRLFSVFFAILAFIGSLKGPKSNKLS